MRRLILLWAVVILSGVLPVDALSTAPAYKKYTPAVTRIPYFSLTYDDKSLLVSVPRDSIPNSELIQRRDLLIRDTVFVKNAIPSAPPAVLFDQRGLHFRDSIFPFTRITDIDLSTRNRQAVLTFYTSSRLDSASLTRMGNRITYREHISIDSSAFVRGVVFSVLGNIDLSGEVNRDVVSLFGNIAIAPRATIRGGIGSLNGQITVSRDASVYGEIHSPSYKQGARRHFFRLQADRLDYLTKFDYNRADGATPDIGIRLHDPDSVIPTVWASGGYAFASKRWHYDVGLEQILVRTTPLSMGGHLYRILRSGDDWIINNGENNVYTLLVTEDLKNYYEAEGGAFYIRLRPRSRISLEAEYRTERTKWLDAHRNLWSVFGKHKRFGENFGTVAADDRQKGIADIADHTLASLLFRADYQPKEADLRFNSSSWSATAEFELSSAGTGSDFKYRRYTLGARRYQRVSRYTLLLGVLNLGNSDGYVPMHKRFFLGGLGTLHGYGQDELVGIRYWLGNAEYRITFPRTEFAVSLLWDVGQVANDKGLGTAEVKHSLGLALGFDNYVKMILAKRLDRSYDDNPKVFVRFERIF